jgi:hypothetical protein
MKRRWLTDQFIINKVTDKVATPGSGRDPERKLHNSQAYEQGREGSAHANCKRKCAAVITKAVPTIWIEIFLKKLECNLLALLNLLSTACMSEQEAQLTKIKPGSLCFQSFQGNG